MSQSPRPTEPIAIVGLGALFPGSTDTASLWCNIVSGRDLLSDVPASHWRIEDYYDPNPAAPDKTYARRGGFLPSIDFDPVEFGIPPSTVPATDTSQILGLIVAQQVLEDAFGGQFQHIDRERISVILGATGSSELFLQMGARMGRPAWRRALLSGGVPPEQAEALCDRIAAQFVPWQEASFPGLLNNVVAGRIANRLDLRGTNCVVDAACASSLGAVAAAVNELLLGQSDLVITGGVDTLNDPVMFTCFSKTPALSASGDCRPLSADADGTMLGEGIGMLALRRLADAERDGDPIYAVIRGVGASSDGRAKSIYAPLAEGQARALRRAYDAAGYSPGTVELIEAHGTGTRAGEAAEFAGLRAVFSAARRQDRQWCAVGSIKSQIGHTKGAAGAAGLIKIALALRHKVLPPTIKVARPDPKLDLDSSPFYVNTASRPWIRRGDHPRRASVSSFGFGGSNYHATVEEYAGPGRAARRLRTAPSELILLSGDSPEALASEARRIAERGGDGLAALARESHQAFSAAAPERLAVVADDLADLRRKLARAADALSTGAADSIAVAGVSRGSGAAAGDVALLFAGQGSQYVGMGADLAMAFDAAREPFDLAAGLPLDPTLRLDQVVFPRPAFSTEERQAQEQLLTRTEWAQPAIGAVSLGQLALLRRLGLRPSCVAGHSFGEVSALCAAGVFGQADLLRVARRRGELMAAAAQTPGAMIAVAHPAAALEALLAEWGLPVVAANYNAPHQVVLSGETDAIGAAERRLAERGIQAKRLPVATAFHSALVAPSCQPLREMLDEVPFAPAQLVIYGNSDASPYPAGADEARRLLAQQLARPVRFTAMLDAMYAAGARTFVEIGPAGVLTRLVGQCLGGRPHLAVALDRKGQHGVTALWHALGALATAGIALDLAALWEDEAPPGHRRPQRPGSVSLSLCGANYGKPAPDALPAAAPLRHATIPPAPPADARASSATPELGSRPEVARRTRQPDVVPASPAASPAASRMDGAGTLASHEALQKLLDVQLGYQRAMADAHVAFLSTVRGLADWQGASPVPNEPLDRAGLLERAPAARSPGDANDPQAHAPPRPSMVDPWAPPKDAAPLAAAPAVDLRDLLLQLVADKTGYPKQSIDLGMDLEAGLGIDSLKRVEIFSALQERLPSIAPQSLSSLSGLQTLRDILSHLQRLLPASAPPPPASSAPLAAAPAVDLRDLLLQLVADKTGYPKQSIDLGMDLEAGLGIDSLKRVEIFSALQERLPSIAPQSLSSLSGLQTLRDILSHLQRLLPASAPPLPQGADDLESAGLAAADEATEVRPADLRFVVREVPAPPAGLVQAGLRAGLIAITDDGLGIAPLLRDILSGHGIQAVLADQLPEGGRGVIFLGGLRPVDEAAAIAVNREAFLVARGAAPALERGPGLFITVQDTSGDFGLGGAAGPRAYLGGLAGLAKTCALEWPELTARAIDLERGDRTPAALAAALACEILAGGPELEVGLHADGRRTTLLSEPAAAEPTTDLPIRAGDLVVVSGGARSVTAACVLALARAVRPNLLLLGRTPVEEQAVYHHLKDEPALVAALLSEATEAGETLTPAAATLRARAVLASREIAANLAAIRAAGAEVRYAQVDVQDQAAVASVIDQARREWGPVRAIWHGAGVVDDRRIVHKTPGQFDRVFRTKVDGLRSLLAATAADPLRCLVLFSSCFARSGSAGQCDYVMANEVLNKVAASEARRRGDVLVRSLDWAPFDGGMVTGAVARYFERLGVPLLPIEDGAGMALVELRTGPSVGTEVALGVDPNALLRALRPPVALHRLEVWVAPAAQPYLADHQVKGEVVVPVVQVLEWLLQAARAMRPDPSPVSVRDLKVLRGIRLPDFATGGWLRLQLRPADGQPDQLRAEVRGPADALHYTATLVFGHAGDAPVPGHQPSIGAGAWPFGVDELYRPERLFHGPAFQAVRSLGAFSSEGAEGTLAGLQELGWPGGPFAIDLAALDGALQLACLWAHDRTGRPCLPTGLEAFTAHRAPSAGPLHCRLRSRLAGGQRALHDVLLWDAAGAIAEIRGLETHAIGAAPVTAALSCEAMAPAPVLRPVLEG